MGVTEFPRPLNPSKAIAMAICPIIVHSGNWRVRSMHEVACEFARAVVRSKDAQKQLARTSLNDVDQIKQIICTFLLNKLQVNCGHNKALASEAKNIDDHFVFAEKVYNFKCMQGEPTFRFKQAN